MVSRSVLRKFSVVCWIRPADLTNAAVACPAFINLFWPQIVNGCTLRRPTEKWLREVGPWSDIDLVQPPDEPWYHLVPHVYGTLIK